MPTRQRFVVCLLIIVFGTLAFGQADVQVTINSVTEVDTAIQIIFGLTNTKTIGGLEFDLVDSPNALEFNSYEAAGRLDSVDSVSDGLSVIGADVDSITHFFWFSMNLDSIESGNDDHIIAYFRRIIPGNISVELSTSEVLGCDPNGVALPSSGDTMVFNFTSSIEGQKAVPTKFVLSQNYPNPFNPTTEIRYEVPFRDIVSINIYNLRGELIRSLMTGIHNPGYYSVIWDSKNNQGVDVASGVYIYRLETRNRSISKKMMLMR